VRRHNLSVREEQILSLICEGWTGKEIARMMDLSLHTIVCYTTRLKVKTGQNRIALLVLWAVVHEVVDPRKTSLSRALLPRRTHQRGKNDGVRENI
jgi:DNA-binding CsgD family transcriptional regulator